MWDFLSSATTEGRSGNEAVKQADSIWRMLDQMAENDPDNYQKFISKHLNEGKEYFALPEPEMVAVTHTLKKNGKIDKRVFINYFSWSRVPAPAKAAGAIPMTGDQVREGIPTDTYVCCIGLSKEVFKEHAKKSADEKARDLMDIVGVSMKYLEAKCEMPFMVRNYRILEGEKIGGSDIKNLRKALMESKDSIEARNGISQMANQFENTPEDQRESMLKKISEAARLRSAGGASSDSSGIQTHSNGETPNIRIPGSTDQSKEKPSKSLIQEIKPGDRPLQKPVHSLTVLHKLNAKGETVREFLLKVALPQLSSASALEVDVGASDFSLFVPGFYQTEILFPQPVNKEEAKAKFSKRSKMLRVTAPVLKASA